MSIESISAIKTCMSMLNIDLNTSHTSVIPARINNLEKKALAGDIDVTFWSNAHSGDGPYISFDVTIKSYGIQFEEFKPKFQEFTFDPSTKTLEIKGPAYNFQLKFE